MSLTHHRRRWVSLGVVALIGIVGACKDAEQQQQTAVDPTEAVFADFARRLDAYMKVREEAEDSVGDLDPTRSQAEIAARATALGQALSARRAQAKPGDIFTPEIATILATLIKEEYSRRPEPVQETRDDQQDELPDFTPQVNQLYPTTYPLATFPPTLLPLLPPLPDKVEYRIVQNYLVLRDIEANLIIDFMPNAVPV